MSRLLRRRSGTDPDAGRGPVTAVVSVTDANAVFLDECLACLAGQQRPPGEVVLAVSGSGADTTTWVSTAVGAHAADGFSVLVVEGDTDEGVRRATGSYLALLEAGDLLAPGALRALAGALDGSGSDLAVAGAGTRLRSTLESAPEAATSVDLAAMVVRTEFWRAAGLRAALGPAVEWLPAVQAVSRAATFDVVGDPVRRGARRGSGVPFNAMLGIAPQLGEVLPWVDLAVTELGAPALRPAQQHLVRWLLGQAISRYLEEAESCDSVAWQLLAELVRRLLELLGGGDGDGAGDGAGLAGVPVESRVRAYLAVAERRVDLEQFNAARWHEDEQYPTELREGRVLAVLPVRDVPDDVLRLAPEETALVTQLRRARWTDEGLLELEVVAWTRRVGAVLGAARVELTLVSGSGRRIPLQVTTGAAPEVNQLAGERHHDHSDGLHTATVDPAVLRAAGPGSWTLHVSWERAGVRRTGEVRDVERRGSVAALEPRDGVRIDLRTASLEHAGAPVRDQAPEQEPATGPQITGPQITGLVLDGDVLVVTGALPGAVTAPAPQEPLTLRLRGPRGTAAATATTTADGFVARLRLEDDLWGLGATPLPPGSYRLRIQGEAGEADPAKLLLGPGPAGRTPYLERSDAFRMRVERNLDGSAQVVLAPPLREDEVGAYAQQELRRWYATDERRLDPRAVFLQSYAGTAVTDSPLAIHRELRRSRPDLRPVWAVADSSVPTPAGAERVLLRSREWYDALAGCAHIVTNTDLDEWFRKRPGQRVLQTFHGYPAKAMGLLAWEAKNFPPAVVERHLRRTAAQWDAILTPHPAMDAHYREQYRYAGRILSGGYPRDDELVGPDAARLREKTRQRLGIGERTAVLYAPTWRDDLTTNFRAAVMPSHLDVERAAEALGEDYVILLRGHRFHRQRPEVHGRLLDVTGYPEVNHLILAADAAVLDYSSLRFDMALTRRPMLFLVPDLDRYESGIRGFLYDFRSSAPGPLLETTDQVVAALRDLDAVAATFRADYDRFHERFNALQDGHAAERVVAAFFGDTPPQG